MTSNRAAKAEARALAASLGVNYTEARRKLSGANAPVVTALYWDGLEPEVGKHLIILASRDVDCRNLASSLASDLLDSGAAVIGIQPSSWAFDRDELGDRMFLLSGGRSGMSNGRGLKQVFSLVADQTEKSDPLYVMVHRPDSVADELPQNGKGDTVIGTPRAEFSAMLASIASSPNTHVVLSGIGTDSITVLGDSDALLIHGRGSIAQLASRGRLSADQASTELEPHAAWLAPVSGSPEIVEAMPKKSEHLSLPFWTGNLPESHYGLWIAGRSGSGKTHTLSLLAKQVHASGLPVFYAAPLGFHELDGVQRRLDGFASTAGEASAMLMEVSSHQDREERYLFVDDYTSFSEGDQRLLTKLSRTARASGLRVVVSSQVALPLGAESYFDVLNLHWNATNSSADRQQGVGLLIPAHGDPEALDITQSEQDRVEAREPEPITVPVDWVELSEPVEWFRANGKSIRITHLHTTGAVIDGAVQTNGFAINDRIRKGFSDRTYYVSEDVHLRPLTDEAKIEIAERLWDALER